MAATQEAKEAARNCGFPYAPGDLVSCKNLNRDHKFVVVSCVLEIRLTDGVMRKYRIADETGVISVTEEAVGD